MTDTTSTTPLLSSKTWKTSYRHEEDHLVEAFYIPALSCASCYDRMTGYFTADALALAARGIENLIKSGGQMRLVVGCTLDPDEVTAVQKGYDLREQIEKKLCEADLTPPDVTAKNGLEALAWLVANGRLDMKVAVPVDPSGRPTSAPGIYHEKVGIITDREENRLSFSGSINETRGGWLNNRESFHVHCSWEAGREKQHVDDEVLAFDKLWTGASKSIRVLDFPEAAKERLLEFLPKQDRFVCASPKVKTEIDEQPEVQALYPEEIRRIVWAYIRLAPTLWNGVRVGEVTSAVQPWPHQIRAYKRLLDAWPCQMLIADEVGLGKTITAGLFIRQAWLAGLAKRVLVLVPRSVLSQWQNELYEKFNLSVPIYDGKQLVWKKTHGTQGSCHRIVERDEWHREPFVLASSQLMRRRDRARDLLESENWDLVLLDEAHHARRKAPGTPQQGGPNQLMRLMQDLRPKAKSLLLLTATPLQVHPIELWDLLRLLGLPGRWGADSSILTRYFELARGNPGQADLDFLAEMFREVETEFGAVDEGDVAKIVPAPSPLDRRAVLKALRDKSAIPLKRLNPKRRRFALEVLRRFSPIRHRMSRHTRTLLREYHRQGLLETPIATRDVRDIGIDRTPSERDLYDAVEDYISTTYNKAAKEERSAVGFVMTIYRRRLASSFAALQRTLTNRLQNLGQDADGTEVDEEDLSQDETADEVMDLADATELSRKALVADERANIQALLKTIAQVGSNTKARTLFDELRKAVSEGYDSAIIFTQYTDTMDYLREELAREFHDLPIGCYSGRGGEVRDSAGFWQQKTKEEIKRLLKAGVIRLLVCTDAAAEGLNLQYCGVIVNFDLPWNPMKVEQRIGRIDRIGQRHTTIRVINLAYKETVEADIYFALSERINLFEGLVGKLQPILARLPKDFETVVLEPKERRDAVRERVKADVQEMVDQAEEAGLDIDEVAIEALALPEMPPPALTLEEIEEALARTEVRPPEAEWKPLDPGSFSLKLPGYPASIRVTTRAEVFEDHADSHEFLSPGGSVFDGLGPNGDVGAPDAETAFEAQVWLVRNEDTGVAEIRAMTADGEVRVDSLSDLRAALGHLGTPRKRSGSGGEEVRSGWAL